MDGENNDEILQHSDAEFCAFSLTGSDEPDDLDGSALQPEDKKSCACKECGRVFNSFWYLKQHAVKHSTERPYKCKLCDKTYRFRSNLYQHKCPSRDPSASLAESPGSNGTSTDSPVGPSSAVLFGDVLASPPRKRQRGGDVQSATAGTCLSCGDGEEKNIFDVLSSPLSSATTFDVPSADEVHRFVERHRHQLHECLRCKIFFPSREYLARHVAWHDDADRRRRQTKCLMCSEAFDDDQTYGVHKQSHAPNSPHVCRSCRGKFRYKLALKRHSVRCRGRFAADDEDDDDFDKSDGIDVTASTALETSTFAVSSSPSLTASSSTSTSTMMTPEALSMKTFSKETAMSVVDVKPFVCDTCNSTFKTDKALRGHFIRVHVLEDNNGLKESAQVVNGSAATHRRRSTVRSDYPCHSCSRIFNSRLAVTRHMATAHNADDAAALTAAVAALTADHRKSGSASSVQVEPQTTASVASKTTAMLKLSRARTLRNATPEECRCRYCPKTFFYQRYVRKHERLQHELPAERQGESSSLVYHLKNAEVFKIRCPLCVKRFSSQRLLKQHLAFHSRADKLSPEI